MFGIKPQVLPYGLVKPQVLPHHVLIIVGFGYVATCIIDVASVRPDPRGRAVPGARQHLLHGRDPSAGRELPESPGSPPVLWKYSLWHDGSKFC